MCSPSTSTNEGSLSVQRKRSWRAVPDLLHFLDYVTEATATGASPEPYEKLIYDVLNNDSTNLVIGTKLEPLGT